MPCIVIIIDDDNDNNNKNNNRDRTKTKPKRERKQENKPLTNLSNKLVIEPAAITYQTLDTITSSAVKL